ncbi:replication initiation protein [Pseudomonas aeruginosa]|nr:replication initiation protein [Pseudomonas aeruginosa]MCC9290261.1 replication initiation protein [Pseudomonas aeruginosa]
MNDNSCLQPKAWNVLLHNAYDDFPDVYLQLHTIPVPDLMDLARFDSKIVKYLKDALEDMVTTKIKSDIIDHQGKSDWAVTTALASASIKDGICSYAYSPELRTKLYIPEFYARNDLLIISRFSSGHALAMYENCARYRAINQTPILPLPLFRELLGVNNTASYDEFKILIRAVIQPAIIEINSISDICLEVEQQREKRKVVRVKFRIQENVQAALAIDSPCSFIHELLRKLQDEFCLTESQAKEALALHSEHRISIVMQYVQEKYTERMIKAGANGIAPYFLRVLRDGDVKLAQTGLDKLLQGRAQASPNAAQGGQQSHLQDDDGVRRVFNAQRRSEVELHLAGMHSEVRNCLNDQFAATLVGQRLMLMKWADFLAKGEASAMVVNIFYMFVAVKLLPPFEEALELYRMSLGG